MPLPTPADAAQFAPSGRLRAAINYGNPVLAQRGPDGSQRGVSVALATALAERLEVPLDFVFFDAAGKVVDAVARDAWDIAFLAIDPLRAEQIAFTAPYVIIEGTYLVRDDAPFREVDDLDRSGVRIAVGLGAAYDLFLSRALKNAELVRAATSEASIDTFAEQRLDAAAGVRQPLEQYAREHPGFRVLPGRFTAIRQAMALPRSRAAALPQLEGYIESMKASGFVADALRASGQMDAQVAPPGAG
ncbi:ABC transporter substrate-binding protein [Piscinibacter koreensis]|uniref:ABC transporter substrate-binding protein n=1 Tax=Piscinibacter koreensis TaxID=2742824 RepID=A0A7Y6NK32_9BURK|nr:ABC transporter substrate-binding protein [Schlegelella koreensis]NUZ04620.1 ABC transporter substrate-binding protein [Schlegelella koreensis]